MIKFFKKKSTQNPEESPPLHEAPQEKSARREYKLVRGTRTTSLVFTLLATFIATNMAIFAANTYFNLDTGEVVVEEVQRVTNVIRATGGMIVGGTATQSPLAGVALEVAGTQNILFSTSGTIQQTGTGTVSFMGNVGLGTTTPAQRLSVAGTLGILEGGASPVHYTIFQGGDQATAITYTLPVNAGGLNHVLTTDGTGVLQWQAVSGVGAGDITAVGSMLSGDAFAGTAAHNQWLGLGAAAGRITFVDAAVDNVNIMDANVGLGITPTERLHVSGNILGTGWLRVADGTAAAPTLGFASDPDTGIFRQALDVLGFTTAGVERARISATGLDIRTGGLLVNGTERITSGGALVNITTLNAHAIPTTAGTLAVSATAPVTLSTAGAIGVQRADLLGTVNRVTVTGGTGVLLGTANATLTLPQDIHTAATPTFASVTATTSLITPLLTRAGALTLQTTVTAGADDMIFQTASAERMRILENGNVGIGVTGPAQRLSVGGTLGILETGATPTHFTIFQGGDQTGTITYTLPVNAGTANHVLVTDGTGILSWQPVSGVGAGDITAVGSMTIGDAFAGTAAHNQWLGLGAAAGRITFVDATIDNINLLDANVGIGAAASPDRLTVLGGARVGQAPATATTLSAAVTTTDTTISVVSTADYPPSGTLLIGSEAMTYTGTTATSFTGVTRGALGTTAAAHSSGATVRNYLFTALATATTPRMVITGDGNVGIGTVAPAQRLSVAGTLGILEGGTTPTHFTIFQGGDQTGTITYTLPVNAGGSNHVLVTDGTGVLSWQVVTGIGGVGDITAVGSMTSGDAFAGTAAHNQWLGLGAAAGRIMFDDATVDRVVILGARLDVDNDIHLTGGNRTIAATGTNANLSLTGSGTGTVTLASASTGNIQFFSGANTITSAGNLTIAGNFAMSGLTITDGGAITTVATTGTDELRIDSASGVISIASGDALRTAGGYTLTSGTILREVHPIFGFDVPVRCSTSCVSPTHQPISRVIETYTFPTAYAGTTRRHHFTIRYAATAATTWRVWNTTTGLSVDTFTLPVTAGPLGAGTVETTANITVPTNGDDWRLEVTLPTTGQTVQVYEVLLGAYDLIN
jgi:hypothetical protein